MALYDIATSTVVSQSFGPASTTYASPAEAYAAWAAALGVSSSASAAGAPLGNDGFSLLDLGFSPLSGGSSKVAWSSEGALALYKTAPADSSLYTTSVAAPPSQLGLSKFVGTASKPTLILASKVYSQDATCSVARWQLSGTTAIFYFEVADWGTGKERVRTAVRLQPGLMEVIADIDPAYSTGVTAHFQALQVNQSGSYSSFTGTSSDPWYTGGTATALAAGTPSRFVAAAGYALGFSTTAFGAASVPGARVAAGIASTVAFGVADARGAFQHTSAAPGTSFGLPVLLRYQPAGWQATTFGQAALRPAAAGWAPVRFGRPLLAFGVDGAPAWFVGADGWQATTFGEPSFSGAVTAQASGGSTTQEGLPLARVTLHASGLAAGAAGLPRAGNRGTAVGWRPTMFGQGYLSGQHLAAGFSPTRWGEPDTRTSAHAARGSAPVTWVGHPAARTGTFRLVPGWGGAALGSPAAACLYRAFHLPPATRFGIPQR